MSLKLPFSKKASKKKAKAKQAQPLPATQKEREARAADRMSRAEARHDPNSKLNIAMPYIWLALAVFLGLSLYTAGGGLAGSFLRFLFLSLFSYVAYAFPIFFFLAGITWRRAVGERSLLRRTVLLSLALLLILAVIYIVTLPEEALSGAIAKEEVRLEASLYFNFSAPAAMRGGFIGALIGWILYRLVGPVLTIVLAALAVLLYGIFGFGFSPDEIVHSMLRSFRRMSRERREAKEIKRAERAERVAAERAERLAAAAEAKESAQPDAPIEVAAPQQNPPADEEAKHRRFADIFEEASHPAEVAPAAPSSPLHESASEAEALRGFKEQKIRERLRSHDGIHTYAVSDLRPSTITEPYDTAPAPAHTVPAGGITHMSADVLNRAAETPAVTEIPILSNGSDSLAGAPTAAEAAPFRGVEDFRRITVTEPVRVHTPLYAPAPEETARVTPVTEETARVAEAPPSVTLPRTEPATATAPAAGTGIPLSIPTSSTAVGEERAIVKDGGVVPEREAVTEEAPKKRAPKRDAIAYQYPPLSLLRLPSLSDDGNSEEEIQKNADTLVKTMESFGIPITITGYSRGPRITRYEFVQKAGIRVSKVASYADDITQKLSTQGVRIEAPIPNKSSIGVEVPNRKSTAVRIRSLLDTDTFRDAAAKTTVAVGCDVTGNPIFFDIAKAPHMLIAGATGMGKSVCINSILISLLYKASPEDVRLILIDPKKVEFNVYSKVPHLLIPVVTDPTKAAGALNWAVNEMEKRYDMIEQAGVRDIKSYNAYCAEEGLPTLPKIVIVIDELNDLMMSARKMVEASICRIAQKARAAGIHLLIGTQRPSVNVITGDIKVNIPARIAFRVNQLVDSRTILDMQGAEKLLPQGDMLFSPAGTPQRVQGAFVEDEEVKTVVSFLAQNVGEAEFDDTILADIEKEAAKCAQKNGDDIDDEEGAGGNLDGVLDDPKFEQALDLAFSTGSISTSQLQRRISIGFGRAARFIDAMCEMGVVGESKGGSRPRELLLSRAEYEERKHRVFDD